MQRWALMLSAYDYTIEHRSGIKNSNADALSRLPMQNTVDEFEVKIPGDVVLVLDHLNQQTTTTAAQIRNHTRRDPTLAKVLQHVQSGWPEGSFPTTVKPYANRKLEFSVDSGYVLWGARVIIPTSLRSVVLNELHDLHTGVVRMKSLARRFVWWPKLNHDIEQVIKECNVCQQHAHLPAKAPIHTWEWPKNSWDRVHVDYAGPIQGSMILVLIDAYSKWIEAHVVSSSTSEVTIEYLSQIFASHGLPKSIISDNGSCFTSDEFSKSPYHPASNGLAERAVQIIKNCVKQMVGANMQNKITRFLSRYRITPQSTTGEAPSVLLMNKVLRSRLDLLKPSVKDRVVCAQDKQ